MHPDLAEPQRQLACGQFIEALQACHDSGWWKRYTGACNQQKLDLTLCLRRERLERTQRNNASGKARREAVVKAWKAVADDED